MTPSAKLKQLWDARIAKIVQERDEAREAAYAGLVAATGYPIAEWVFEYHPFLKDYKPKKKVTQ